MNKYIILISILGIGIIMLLFGLGSNSIFDYHYLFGKIKYPYLPKEIQSKHITTIEKVDILIRKENKDSITSQSENFNLELYLKFIEIGVYPYLKEGDPLRIEVQLLMEDIKKYIKQ
jgi:hypothetical protein